MHRIDLSDTRQRTLPRILAQQACHNGDTVFLRTDDEQLTFAQTYEKCRRLAAGLAAQSIGKADHVGLFMHNSPDMVLLALASNMLGAIWVPICTDYKGAWLSDTIHRSRPKILVCDAKLLARIDRSALPGGCRIIVCDNATATSAGSANPPAADSLAAWLTHAPHNDNFGDIGDYGDTAAIVWTSGTTGRSKGVMVSHNGWLRPIEKGSSVFFDSQAGDIMYNVLPMYHAGAWNTSILRALVEGITVAIEQRFSVTTFWQRVAHFQATQAFTLGAMHMFLWHAKPTADDTNNTLRVLQAIPIAKDLITPFEQRFGLRLAGSGFGQSECMLVVTQAGANRSTPTGSLGFAVDDTEVGIFDDDDQPLPAGSVGEIRLKPLAPHIVCNGYLDDDEAFANTWRGGWFCTGDLGYTNSDGAFFFSDRKKDAVRFAGRNISTMEVESVVRQHPDVVDVAAFGIPSKQIAAEDELKINIVLGDDSNATYEDIAAFINANAPYYFVPRYMEFVTQLPYTPTNKVQKYLLKQAPLTATVWDLKRSDFTVVR